MTYANQLRTYKEYNLDLGQLRVAVEVASVFDTMSESDFEKICGYIYDMYYWSMSYDLNEMCHCVKDYIKANCNSSISEFIYLGVDYPDVLR